jgi:hypothetical protein
MINLSFNEFSTLYFTGSIKGCVREVSFKNYPHWFGKNSCEIVFEIREGYYTIPKIVKNKANIVIKLYRVIKVEIPKWFLKKLEKDSILLQIEHAGSNFSSAIEQINIITQGNPNRFLYYYDSEKIKFDKKILRLNRLLKKSTLKNY